MRICITRFGTHRRAQTRRPTRSQTAPPSRPSAASGSKSPAVCRLRVFVRASAPPLASKVAPEEKTRQAEEDSAVRLTTREARGGKTMLEAGALERAQGLLQAALAAGNSEAALKICEDFEMEVISRSRPCRRAPAGRDVDRGHATVADIVWHQVRAEGFQAAFLPPEGRLHRFECA